jgi:hypothetical protein
VIEAELAARQSLRAGDQSFGNLEDHMSTAIARLLPRALASSVTGVDSLVAVALFSGIGLLLSLSVVILDQYIPGEWF